MNTDLHTPWLEDTKATLNLTKFLFHTYKKFDNTDERDKFLEKHKLSKCTQEEMDNLNILIFIKGIEFKIKSLPTNKTLDGDGCTEYCYC